MRFAASGTQPLPLHKRRLPGLHEAAGLIRPEFQVVDGLEGE
jgi:hypothetical protein